LSEFILYFFLKIKIKVHFYIYMKVKSASEYDVELQNYISKRFYIPGRLHIEKIGWIFQSWIQINHKSNA
jgi:hypothetical protein